MWDLPEPGLEPMSPALAGGFLTTAPPEKPHHPLFKKILLLLLFLIGRECCLGIGIFFSFFLIKPFLQHFLILFIYLFLLCWVFVSVWGLSLVVASRGLSSSRCAGLWLSRPLLLQSTGSRRAGSVIVAYGPGCSVACGIFPDQGSNPCPLHWQADSQPLCHQGSPTIHFLTFDGWHRNCPGAGGCVIYMLMYYNKCIIRLKVYWRLNPPPSWT